MLHSHSEQAERAQIVDLTIPDLVSELTTTSLEVDGVPAAGAELTLAASVEPAGASGSVTFHDGATELATVDVESGTASTDVVLSDDSHTLVAAFTPASQAWQPSESDPVLMRTEDIVGAGAS